MGLFSSRVSARDVVDRMVRGGVVSQQVGLSKIGYDSGRRHTTEQLLTLLAVERLTWEVALSRVSGDAIDRIREAMGKHYGEILLKELGKRVKTSRRATREEKMLLALSLARQVRGRAAALGREWNAHRHDRPGPEYWACRRAVQLMGLDESNPAYVTRLSARVKPVLASNTEYIRDVARRVKIDA